MPILDLLKVELISKIAWEEQERQDYLFVGLARNENMRMKQKKNSLSLL
jgi:hypothetical protein